MTTVKPLLVDLFCKAGGSTKGYQRAGFYVVGVDIEPQPNYCGDEFILGDALAVSLDRFDAIHAGPPCQGDLRGLRAVNQKLGRAYPHRSLLREVRGRLAASGKPYVIEQPEQGAELINPVRLCGTGFSLPIRRHRLFESNVPLYGKECAHFLYTEKKYWTGWVKDGRRQLSTVVQVYGNGANRHEWGPALGIDWMTPAELTQAIPPVYTEHIGCQVIARLMECAA